MTNSCNHSPTIHDKTVRWRNKHFVDSTQYIEQVNGRQVGTTVGPLSMLPLQFIDKTYLPTHPYLEDHTLIQAQFLT